MTRGEALYILQFQQLPSAEELRRAYKKFVLLAHPDKGGTTAQFLQVQDAYECLRAEVHRSSGDTYRHSESVNVDQELVARLDAIDVAFHKLFEEMVEPLERWVEGRHQRLVDVIASYSSHEELQRRSGEDIARIWMSHAQWISAYLENGIKRICIEEEMWIQARLKPAIDAARACNPPKWYESLSFLIATVATALFFGSLACRFSNFLWLVPSVPLVILGIVLPHRYKQKYSPKKIFQPIRLTDLSSADHAAFQPEEVGLTSEGTSVVAGNIAAVVGGLFLGPFGAIGAGAIVGFLGSLFGVSLQSRKEKLYKKTLEAFDERFPILLETLDQKMDEVQKSVFASVKESLSKNVLKIVALTEGS